MPSVAIRARSRSAVKSGPRRPKRRRISVRESVTSFIARIFDGTLRPVRENSGWVGRTASSPETILVTFWLLIKARVKSS